MEPKEALKHLKAAKEVGGERNFTQSVDLIFNLKDINLKQENVDFYATIKHDNGKKFKICALTGPELAEEAAKVCDHTIKASDFKALTPTDVKHLANEYHYFIAQANVMPQVAQAFGRVLGPRGKMPNPKAGQVVPPKTNLQPLYDRLQHTLRVTARKDPVIHLKVGSQDQDEKEVAENIADVYNQLVAHLPLEQNNIKSSILKLTMGQPVVF